MIKGKEIVDMHVHLRNDIARHTRLARNVGIDTVVYMANSIPALDNLDIIKKSLEEKRYCKAIPVSAITKNLEGKELVDIENIRKYVAGFSDDGNCLKDLGLFREALSTKALILVHCEPETEMLEKYLEVLKEVKNGKLHIQHVSKKESVELIREAKKSLQFTCETCPQYFTDFFVGARVNPPIGKKQDREEIKRGLVEKTLDVITSDYAPEPRKTGIANFSFLFFSYELVKEKLLSEEEMLKKISENPKKILNLR